MPWLSALFSEFLDALRERYQNARRPTTILVASLKSIQKMVANIFKVRFLLTFSVVVSEFFHILRQMGETIQFDLRIFFKRVVQPPTSQCLVGGVWKNFFSAPVTLKPQDLRAPK